MKIVVASGKGGVGKSMLASSLSILFSEEKKVVACDCDVDAPNLGLWLGITEYDKSERISVSEKARIVNQEACDDRIIDICKFHAIEKKDGRYVVNPFLCEGCGVCKILYPKAIEIKPVENAEIRTVKTRYGFPLVSGQLYPGETGSGKIVQELRKKANGFEHETMILDAAAGIGCPVIASMVDSDFAVLVTEPTPSGISDLGRILEIVDHFKLPYAVVINKCDINPAMSSEIEKKFKDKLLGKISYDKKVIEAVVSLKPVIFSDSKTVDEIKKIFESLKRILQ